MWLHDRRNAMLTWPVAANLLVLYTVWGSTYLAIRVMVRTIPPLLGIGLRFLVAGTLLYALCAARGFTPRHLGRSQLLSIMGTGVLTVAVSLGLLAVAEQAVPSAIAALVMTSVPLWGVLLRLAYRDTVQWRAIVGLFIGVAGVAMLLFSPDGGAAGAGGILVLVAAALAEAAGTFYIARLTPPPSPLFTAALQMLTGGIALLVTAVAIGERISPVFWRLPSLWGLLYLVGPGSLLAYVSLVWLLSRVPVSLATTYVYVNPVVAVLLGWVFLAENITWVVPVASVLVIVSVGMVLHTTDAERSR